MNPGNLINGGVLNNIVCRLMRLCENLRINDLFLCFKFLNHSKKFYMLQGFELFLLRGIKIKPAQSNGFCTSVVFNDNDPIVEKEFIFKSSTVGRFDIDVNDFS